jgi:cell division ATPase FtsA
VARELKAAKFISKVPCGVVLTGGSAYLANIEELFARELNMEVRLGRMLYGLDDDSQQQVSAYPQSVALGLLLYGAQHNSCETALNIQQIIEQNKKRQNEPTTVEKEASENGLDFSDTGINVGQEATELPKADTTPIPEKVDMPEEVVATTPTEFVGPSEELAEEQEKETLTPEPEKQEQPSDSKKSKKSGFGTRLRGFVDQFRNKVDDMFTGDDFI